MEYEVSERIITTANKEEILNALKEQFKKVSEVTSLRGDNLEVKSIDASFGSINRSDKTNIYINDKNDGFLLVANVKYRPSVAFWIILLLTIFSTVFWLIPIIFYMTQKKTVREGIENVFNRIKNEYNNQSKTEKIETNSKANFGLEELEKLANLKEKGIITEEEFKKEKSKIIKI